jgi:hypothetical protein
MPQGPSKITPPLLAAVLTLVSLGASSCGGTDGHTGQTARSSSGGSSSQVAQGNATSSYLNDGDEDATNDNDLDNGQADNDNDYPEDNPPDPENDKYHDRDDSGILSYGHRANTTDTHEIATLVEHYYSAAAAEDGNSACLLLLPGFAKGLAEDYGRSPGPTYLRGGKSCQTVLAKLFLHFHPQLTNSVTITNARVNGNQGLALLGSHTMPASDMPVERKNGHWKIVAILASPLP